jgi:hypothetical protein
MAEDLPRPSADFLLHQTEDGKQRIECRVADETLWLSLQQIAALFDRDKSVNSKHLKNIFEEGEIVRESVVARNATTAADGKTYRRLIDQQPSEVDSHLADALQKLERMDKKKNP